MPQRSLLVAALVASILGLGCLGCGSNTPADGPGVPEPFVLRLVNNSQDVVYIELTCSQGWVEFLDGGQRIEINDDCGVCPCDTNECALCDCAFLFEPLSPGNRRDHNFDGFIHEQEATNGGGTCRRAVTLTPGTYTARFCYSTGDDSQAPRECGDVEFLYPDPGLVVEYVIE